MNFKQEFSTALRSGAKHELLLDIVRRHLPMVANRRELYDVLQEIWLEFGFEESVEESPLRDELEYVMERAWFGLPAKRA